MKSVAYCVVLWLAGVASAQEKPELKKSTPYFPLVEGSTWTYKLQSNSVVTKVIGFEKIGDDVCAKLETRRGKDLVATEWYTVKDDGVYRCKFADKVVTPPVVILKLPVKNNDTWKSKVGDSKTESTFTVGEMKGLKIDKDKYDTITVTAKGIPLEGQEATTIYYFAEKYGMVKQVVEIGGSKIELDLEKYEEAKK